MLIFSLNEDIVVPNTWLFKVKLHDLYLTYLKEKKTFGVLVIRGPILKYTFEILVHLIVCIHLYSIHLSAIK